MIAIKYQNMAQQLQDYSFLGANEVYIYDTGQTYTQHKGKLYSMSTAAESRFPLSYFLELAHKSSARGVLRVACHTISGRDFIEYINDNLTNYK